MVRGARSISISMLTFSQPPKSLSPAAKQALILEWFHKSLAAHPKQDLEKLIPGIAPVNKMQVMEHVQALVDEGLVRVEKIGSGNWYWAFVSDAKKTKDKMFIDLQAEENKLQAAITEVEKQTEEEMAQREDDDDILEDGGLDRKSLLEVHETLLERMEILSRELSGYNDNDPTKVLRKAEEIKKFQDSAERWTDNIEAIESFLIKKIGDRNEVRQIMASVCGEEYVIGEGLREL